jgi:hypothetical protein
MRHSWWWRVSDGERERRQYSLARAMSHCRWRGGNPTSKYACEMEPREMKKRQEKELLRADCRESRCLGCRRITRLVRA